MGVFVNSPKVAIFSWSNCCRVGCADRINEHQIGMIKQTVLIVLQRIRSRGREIWHTGLYSPRSESFPFWLRTFAGRDCRMFKRRTVRSRHCENLLSIVFGHFPVHFRAPGLGPPAIMGLGASLTPKNS